MPVSFFIADISEVGRKNTILILWFLIPPSQNEAKYSHNKCVLSEKALKLVKSRKAKKK